MKSYRIGKTLKIRWGILTGGKSEPLSGRDLRLEIATGSRFRRDVSFEADGSVAEFVFQGSEQRYVGAYTVTMWENRGKENQTVVDRCDAFCLVACSCEESAESADEPNLDVETLELGSSNLETGVPGKSAYELFKEHNPDSELTEEQYAEAPVQAAGAALAMVERLEETEASVKQGEQLRVQAEQVREASERARATAEQTRITAEQQRALAEQTRVTNESARQTAEVGRQAAETKREENTSEAIRNCESATQEAEDEAARVRTLADNPPKIVDVDGARYWAFWDEATEQYVTSENRADVGDAVLFSPQELNAEQRAQVQTNIGVKSAVDVIGAGEAQAIPMNVAEDGKYRFYTGGIDSSSSYFISKPFSVKRGDIILGRVAATGNVGIISQVDSDNNFIRLLLRGTGGGEYIDVSYIVTQDMQISFSANKSVFSLILIPCELVKSLAEPAGGYNRKLYESYGAVYNEETGFYELNGFADITEEEMWNIYRYLNFNDMSMFVGEYPYDGQNLKVRTNIPFQSTIQNSSSISVFRIAHKWSYLCSNLRYVEKIVISRNPEDIYLCADNYIGCNYLLYGCDSLVEVEGVIDFSKYEGNLTYVFSGCSKLKSFRLRGVHNTTTFKGSPCIDLDTLKYVIENATNSKAITITVAPTTYGYLTGTIQPTPEVGGTTEEWQALVTAAQEKQISFASA